jgi:hypothetical protein
MTLGGAFVFVLILNMYTIHLETLGAIHDFQCIAANLSLETKKAGPFLTLFHNFAPY